MSDQQERYFRVQESGALSVIQLTEAVTDPTTNIHDVLEVLTAFAVRNNCQKLVFDLTATSYLPSTVIGIFAVLSSKGLEVHLANASADIAGIIQVMGLSKHVRVNEFVLPSEDFFDDDDSEVVSAVIAGYFLPCPACESRLRIDKHLLGSSTKCSHCHAAVRIDSERLKTATHVFCTCPGCKHEMELTAKFPTSPVACQFCNAQVSVRKIL